MNYVYEKHLVSKPCTTELIVLSRFWETYTRVDLTYVIYKAETGTHTSQPRQRYCGIHIPHVDITERKISLPRSPLPTAAPTTFSINQPANQPDRKTYGRGKVRGDTKRNEGNRYREKKQKFYRSDR
jgi:hypothetical protein